MKIKILKKYTDMIGLRINSPLHKGKNTNYVFIHINKTAGTSIVDVIGKPFRKHLTVKDVINVIGQQKWDEAYTFTVIRNPWDKVVSQYKHAIKMNSNNMAKKSIEFKDWVACTYGEPKDPFYYGRAQMFFPQVEWLKNFQGKIDVDKIIRFENLNEGINEVFNTLAIDSDLPHLNETHKTNYRDFYDNESKQIISEWFHEDIQVFEYTF
jgi:chondroitin 4-sulfotransferase 11